MILTKAYMLNNSKNIIKMLICIKKYLFIYQLSSDLYFNLNLLIYNYQFEKNKCLLSYMHI